MTTELVWYKLAWVEVGHGKRAEPTYWHTSEEEAKSCLSTHGRLCTVYGPMLKRYEDEWDEDYYKGTPSSINGDEWC